ncbi:copia protein [Lasius niger]|uniref:Copia protein n=1 Tax=Lasius niger TaxID=67767 RepID=A0A0J7K4F2_LASNI|nr:copia protein [Lasius niger]
MLQARKLSAALWAEAVNTAVYILNRTLSSQVDNITPFEMWTGKKPDLSNLRIFGSDAFVHVPKQLRGKLDSKAKKMMLVGYKGNSGIYRLYDPGTKRVIEVRDVIFNEKNIAASGACPKNFWPGILHADKKKEGNNEGVIEPDEDGDQQPIDQRPSLRDRSRIKRPSRFKVNIAEWDEPFSF